MNYSLDGIAERAQVALERHRGYVAHLEERYLAETERRRRQVIPALAVVGMGRAGKDTAAEFLAGRFHLKPVRSSSLTAKPLVAHMVGGDPEVVYAERHQHREFWIHACNQLRATDLTRLARWCLGACDHAVGLRGKTEFEAVMAQGVCDLSVWVDRDVPDDPTTEFPRDFCDLVIENRGTLAEFHAKLLRFGKVAYGRVC